MGLLDTGFGMGMSFKVKRLGELREAQSEMTKTLKNMKDLQMQARMRGDSRMARDIGHTMGMTRGSIANVRGQMRDLQAESAQAQARMAGTGKAAMAVGGAMIAAGGAGVLFMKKAVTEAVKFDAAMNGIRIRAKFTEAQMANLGRRFRNMAVELPGTAADMARAAEVVIRAGVRELSEIEGTTRSAIALSVAEGMEASVAAESLSAMYMMFGQSMRNAAGEQMNMAEATAKLSSAIIAAGNATPIYAREVVDMSKRSGQAAAMLGLTADQAMGVVAALGDLKVRPEMAGTALTKFYMAMADKAPLIAKFAGVAIEAYTAMTPVQRIETFMGALNKLQAEEKAGSIALGSYTAALKQFGLSNVRTKLVVGALQMSVANLGKQDKSVTRLNEVVTKVKGGFDAGTLAGEMMEGRLKSLSQQWSQLGATLNMIMISLGTALFPILKMVTAAIRRVAFWLNGLDESTKSTIAYTIAFASALLLLGGVAILALGLFMVFGGGMITMLAGMGITATSVAGAFAAMWTAILWPIILVAAKIILVTALISAALYGLAKIGFFDPLIAKFKQIAKAIGVAWDVISGKKIKIEDKAVLDKLGITGLVFWLQDAYTAAKQFFGGLAEGLGAAEKSGVPLSELIGFLWNQIAVGLAPVFRDLMNALGMTGAMSKSTGSFMENLGMFIGYLIAQLKYIIPIIAMVIRVWAVIWGAGMKVVIGIVGGMIKIIKGIVSIVYNVGRLIYGIFTGNWEMIKDSIAGILQGIFDYIGGIFGMIYDVTIGWAVSMVVGFGDILFPGFRAMFDKIVGKVKAVINKVRGWLGLGVAEEKAAAEKTNAEAAAQRKAEAARRAKERKNDAARDAAYSRTAMRGRYRSAEAERRLQASRAAKQAEVTEQVTLEKLGAAWKTAFYKRNKDGSAANDAALKAAEAAYRKQESVVLAAQKKTQTALVEQKKKGYAGVVYTPEGEKTKVGVGTYRALGVGAAPPGVERAVSARVAGVRRGRAAELPPGGAPVIPITPIGGAAAPSPTVAPPPVREGAISKLVPEIRRLAESGMSMSEAASRALGRPVKLDSSITLNVDGQVLAQAIAKQTARQGSLRGTVPPVATSPAGR